MSIRVAVIGVGSMGENHARVYSEIPEVELVAVSDNDETIASGIGNKYKTAVYTNYVELLEKECPEAVSIVVPTALHKEVALTCLEAGTHILIEKPITATIEDGQYFIEKYDINIVVAEKATLKKAQRLNIHYSFMEDNLIFENQDYLVYKL